MTLYFRPNYKSVMRRVDQWQEEVHKYRVELRELKPEVLLLLFVLRQSRAVYLTAAAEQSGLQMLLLSLSSFLFIPLVYQSLWIVIAVRAENTVFGLN